jgi:flavin reductase (DIM6/NTAB) family NADH-FMN oxidoreductase RutF
VTERTDFDPAGMSGTRFYALLNSVVVPRPIAWVSSTSPDGVDNLAPHSFFTVASTKPPIVQFTSVGRKDSLKNIEQTREFVINLTPEALFEHVNATGTNFPAEKSEFDEVGVAREPSRLVRPPRVADSPAVLECELHSTVSFGSSTVVFGRVVWASVDSGAVAEDGLPDLARLRPLSRLGRDDWGLPPEVVSISRIDYADWPGHFDR